MTGYAVSFNRRHRRHGQLFQNRYKSILCQEDVYLIELVRYIHLNPLRARLVNDWGARELGMTTVALAKKVNLAQPTVSQAIVKGQKMAEELGLNLRDHLNQ